MNASKIIFNGFNPRYIIRSYIISAIFLALSLTITLENSRNYTETSIILIYFILCAILFPFSKLVWDELKALALGDGFLILPIIFLYPAKFFINLVLWNLALFIAPFGMGYLWFKTKAFGRDE